MKLTYVFYKIHKKKLYSNLIYLQLSHRTPPSSA